MRIKKLTVRQFRSFDACEHEWPDGVSLISGKNGSGKTSLIEAIHVLATGRSFRAPNLKTLIKEGQDLFFAEMHFEKEGIEHTLSLGYSEDEKRLLYDGELLPTFTKLYGLFPIVVIAPADIQLITGAPSDRRRFLDAHIAALDTNYLEHLVRYSNALKQRNALLKAKCEEGLALFEEQMVKSAEFLVAKRMQALTDLNTMMAKNEMSHDAFKLRYLPSIDKDFQKRFEKNREKELLLGTTISGPHRDDFAINSGDQLAKVVSSEGQKHSFAILLKLACWELLAKKHSVKPLLCIDDYGVHLDPKREKLLEDSLTNRGQVILTAPTHSGKLQLDPFHSLDQSVSLGKEL